MSAHDRQIGGTPVGQLDDLGQVEACAVVYLRLWADGAGGQQAIWNDLTAALGAERARTVLAQFEDIVALMSRHGRRPLMRHALQCRCVGGDEACFGTFIATAATGEREDAMLMAMLMIRPDFAPQLTAAAADFGLGLKQMQLRRPPQPAPLQRPAGVPLH